MWFGNAQRAPRERYCSQRFARVCYSVILRLSNRERSRVFELVDAVERVTPERICTLISIARDGLFRKRIVRARIGIRRIFAGAGGKEVVVVVVALNHVEGRSRTVRMLSGYTPEGAGGIP